MEESRFDIIARISQGGMSEIYHVYDKKRKEEVILKKLLEKHCNNRKIMRMFYKEARLVLKLDHPNIQKIYEIGEDNKRPFVLREYFKSGHLRDLINKMPSFGWSNAIDVLYKVGLALDYIHKERIIHLDIKPSNILVNDELKVKLTDFGMASTFFRGKFRLRRYREGTPSYMSPEQIIGRGVDRRSDIYSFGVTAYEILTRRLPFSGENLNQLFSKHMSGIPPKAPSKIIGDIPPAMDKIILRCMEKDKNNRYQDMTHLLADIGRIR